MKSDTIKKPCFVKVLETNLQAEILESFLAFHAVAGCDTTSQFTSIGKKTAWQVFRQYPHLFNKLGEHGIPSGAAVSVVKEFVCTTTKSIQMVWCNMFRRLQTKIDSLPPRRDALTQHIKRAHYQTKVWKQSLTTHPDLPSPILQIVAGTWLIGCSFLCTWQQIRFNPIAVNSVWMQRKWQPTQHTTQCLLKRRDAVQWCLCLCPCYMVQGGLRRSNNYGTSKVERVSHWIF